MSESSTMRHAPADRIGRWLFAATKGFALVGGLILVGLTLMSLASIAGRSLLSKPVPGDYELVQLGIAVAVASFLPFCQMRGGHVHVDFFSASARPATRATLDAIGALLVAVVAVVVAWRLTAGAASLHEANDQTTVLGVPTWCAVALMVPSFALFAAAGLYTAWSHWRQRESTAPGAGRS